MNKPGPMNSFKTMDDLDVSGKRVLLRTDLNVPMQNGTITDTTRIERTLPTIRELAGNGATVVILSHFGRPEGEVVPDLSLAPVASVLGEALGGAPGQDMDQNRDQDISFTFCQTTVGAGAEAAVANVGSGNVILMENLRFNGGEESNDTGFAVQLAALGDLYVNDAFSAAHRAHASTEAITALLPTIAGRLMQEELEALEGALDSPEHPVAAIVGGAKVSTKMEVLNHLMDKVDYLIIGGGMANTFLYADGVEIGMSLCEKDMAGDARAIRDAAAAKGCEIIIPGDAVVAWKFEAHTRSETVGLDAVPAEAMILDVGPASVAAINRCLAGCKTLIWNGPVGAFEINPFDTATNAIAQEAARLTTAGSLLSVAGGGDTVSALANAGVADRFSYVSTAGGAFLEWLEGRELPAVAALKAHR